jgi:DNA repair protein RecO (recombination protein O)
MEQGPVRLEHPQAAAQVISGQTLLDIGAEDFTHARSRIEAKNLMRTLIGYYLSGKELQSRKIYKELQEL